MYLPVSFIGQIHIVKASFILIAQSSCLIQTFTGGTFAIVLEAYEPVGRWALITTFSYVYANPLYACRTAATATPSCINGRILPYDCTILELLPVRVNAYRVVLLTSENVLVALVLVRHPWNVVWIGSAQVLACVRGIAEEKL
jgi:hypothetical protein